MVAKGIPVLSEITASVSVLVSVNLFQKLSTKLFMVLMLYLLRDKVNHEKRKLKEMLA